MLIISWSLVGALSPHVHTLENRAHLSASALQPKPEPALFDISMAADNQLIQRRPNCACGEQTETLTYI